MKRCRSWLSLHRLRWTPWIRWVNLTEEMERGAVVTLIVLGGNPAFESQAFLSAMTK